MAAVSWASPKLIVD